jgi:hypothetical protein
MQTVKAGLVGAWGYFWKYLELALALALAIVLSYFSIAGEISTKGLTLGAVGLLIAIAIALVRERKERESLLAQIKSPIEVPGDHNSWQVLDERNVWDLGGPHGCYAKATAEKELQFMQNEVFSIYEYQYGSPGKVLSHVCAGGPKGAPMVDLRIIQDDFPGPDRRIYRIISLQRIWRRGEIMVFKSERELENFFPANTEDVTKEVSVPTARVSMKIVWPPGEKPTDLSLERSKRSPVYIRPEAMKCDNGRWIYEEVITDPHVGEKIILKWTWQSSP